MSPSVRVCAPKAQSGLHAPSRGIKKNVGGTVDRNGKMIWVWLLALRAAALTRQLLAFGRKQIMQPRMISVNVELTEIHRMLRRIIREDIALNLALAPDIGVVKTDPVQIQQILLNLAMNGQDAMPDGGTLTIETANVDIDASYARSHRDVQPGPYVQLAVSDTGTGMDTDTLAHLFEPFFTTKSPGKGTGLGRNRCSRCRERVSS